MHCIHVGVCKSCSNRASSSGACACPAVLYGRVGPLLKDSVTLCEECVHATHITDHSPTPRVVLLQDESVVTVQQALERLGAREVLHDMYCSKTNTEVCAWVWAGVRVCSPAHL